MECRRLIGWRMYIIFEDALLVGSMLDPAMLRHADRVKGSMPGTASERNCSDNDFRYGRMGRQTIFYPYMHASVFGRGNSAEHTGSGLLFMKAKPGGFPVWTAYYLE